MSPSLYKKLGYDPQKDLAPISLVANIPNIMSLPAALGMVQANKVRALAVLSPKRLASVPDVPTTREAGVKDFEVAVWFGILAPANTPAPVITRLNTEVAKAAAAPDLRERYAAAGIEPLTSTPGEFASFVKSETVRYAKVIKDAGIPAE